MRVADLIAAGGSNRFLYLGDVYDDGSASDFAENFGSIFGRFDVIAAPTPGNHEWANRDVGYFPYWARVHGAPVPEYYAFRVGGWQILSLNSETEHSDQSPQLRWLRRRVGRTPGVGTCRIAYWHRPRFSAGRNGDQEDVEPFWAVLAGKARIIINGHDHNMQRFNERRRIVEFVSGTGGHELRDVNESDPRLAFARDGVPGALRLVLRRRSAEWAFVAATGVMLESGHLRCHRPTTH